MRKVSVGKACAVAALAVAISSAISGAAVATYFRGAVFIRVPDPHILAAACEIVVTMHKQNPNQRIMLHPDLFR
jgi:hypothetical protein